MARLNTERQKKLEPQRIQEAVFQIASKGYEIQEVDNTTVTFLFKGNLIKYHAYSGWASGKGIKDGRGLKNLLKQI